MGDVALLIENFLSLFMESAPWLLLGLLVAGVMHELVPVSLLQKHMGSNSIAAVSKAAVIGAPLPLCSCGVIPAAIGLRRSGASKPATVSFLVSTPETGVDSVSVSYALLGPVFAIVRPVAAVISAIYAGLMVRWFGDKDITPSATPAVVPGDMSASSSCCASQSSPAASPVSTTTGSCCDSNPVPQSAVSEDGCCSTSKKPAASSVSVTQRMLDVWQYASGKLLDDIIVWLLIGLVLAAAIKTWVPTDFLTQWGDGFIAMIVMALIGIPMYICATASTPIAVGFLAAGLSPGAVLVFLMAGPATNISTMGMINQEMGRRTLMLYLFSVISMSIVSGYGLNILVSGMGWENYIVGSAAEHLHAGAWQSVYALCAILLAALMIRNVVKKVVASLRRPSEHSDCCH
ncbi:SO_0444 family Cu/Zn efflux transporter [Alteromonas sp. H39]|uniref:SO_0444 family Cu/Zn efflux transporter n=1 Tax=Alteromonas sp. H39 TaxID=3389876 RepID=UPI0039E06B4E